MRTTKALGERELGNQASLLGEPSRSLRTRCEPTCCRLQPPKHVTSETIRRSSSTIPIYGRMSMPFLNSPGQAEIQSDLFYDYRTNVEAYPKWQAWMQKTQPKLLVIWGKHELSFDPGEPERYRKDVPHAEVHVLDAGHFALDTKADEIASLVREFMKTQK